MERIYLSDIHLSFIGAGEEAEVPDKIPDLSGDYPEVVMFGRWPPAYGLFCRYVEGLFLHGIDLWLEGKEKRNTIQITDVINFHCGGITVNGKIAE